MPENDIELLSPFGHDALVWIDAINYKNKFGMIAHDNYLDKSLLKQNPGFDVFTMEYFISG